MHTPLLLTLDAFFLSPIEHIDKTQMFRKLCHSLSKWVFYKVRKFVFFFCIDAKLFHFCIESINRKKKLEFWSMKTNYHIFFSLFSHTNSHIYIVIFLREKVFLWSYTIHWMDMVFDNKQTKKYDIKNEKCYWIFSFWVSSKWKYLKMLSSELNTTHRI